MKSKEEIEAGLAGFYGTEQYHRFSILFKNHVLTDGVKWLCDNADCFWLMDVIASYHAKCMKDPKGMLQDMQFWTLTVHPKIEEAKPMTIGAVMKGKPKPMATVICERDTGDVAITQKIPHTDFPLPEIKLYCSRADENLWVIMLPSEY
jgi:hypothetical protein